MFISGRIHILASIQNNFRLCWKFVETAVILLQRFVTLLHRFEDILLHILFNLYCKGNNNNHIYKIDLLRECFFLPRNNACTFLTFSLFLLQQIVLGKVLKWCFIIVTMQLNANLQPSLNIVLYVSKIIIIFSKNVLLKYYCQINVP